MMTLSLPLASTNRTMALAAGSSDMLLRSLVGVTGKGVPLHWLGSLVRGTLALARPLHWLGSLVRGYPCTG